MEDKKLLYGILAVCVVTLVVSGISVYEVNTVAKQLNTQGEQIAALQEAQAPMNIAAALREQIQGLEKQVSTQGRKLTEFEPYAFPENQKVIEGEEVVYETASEKPTLSGTLTHGGAAVLKVEDESAEETLVTGDLATGEDYTAGQVEVSEVEDESAEVRGDFFRDEGINPNGPPENRMLLTAEESESARDADILRGAASTTQSGMFAS